MSNLIKPSMRHSLLFKIISECNDSCNFCLEHKFIKTKRPALSLDELRENYFYFKKKYNIDYVILTGGEPTLHPQFFEILEFFKKNGESFRVISNLLKFNENNFLDRSKIIFSDFKNEKQKNSSKIIASINDLPRQSVFARERFSGFRNSLRVGLPIMVTTVIYRQNIKNLPVLFNKIISLFKTFASDSPIFLELRLIYIEGTEPILLKKSLPENFFIVKKMVEKSVDIAFDAGAKLTLWNFPLCYLHNYKKIINTKIAERQSRRLIKIHKVAQLKNAEVRDWEDYLKSDQACFKCQLKSSCSGMDVEYIKKYDFHKFKPFIGP